VNPRRSRRLSAATASSQGGSSPKTAPHGAQGDLKDSLIAGLVSDEKDDVGDVLGAEHVRQLWQVGDPQARSMPTFVATPHGHMLSSEPGYPEARGRGNRTWANLLAA